MDPYDPIDQAVRAIVNLGIATTATIVPHVAAWRERPVTEDTQDEDTELAGFLTALHQAGVLTRNQGRTLLAMLTGSTAGGMPPDDPYLGHRFGSYIAEAKIGEGGMGKVYRAARVGSLESNYVIKVFSATADGQALARFKRECEVMASLDHPNIIKVYAAGQEGTLPYLILEYVEGPTLQELVEERGKFNWKSATRAVKQIASALAGAHEQNVIHRDIKPHNILVARGGILKVFDFGLAKTMDSKVVSHAGEILGSPAYMAPEQWGDHEVDQRVDVYALGVIYYLLLTGQLPFKGRTPADFSWKIQAGRYDPVERVMPDVPAPVCNVVTQLLERDRNHRPPHARALLADLDRILRGQFPDVPRLEGLEGDGPTWALLGAANFDVGSAAQAHVRLQHASIDERHALLERTLGGVLLRDLEARGGSRVNGRKVREIILRDKDRLQFGEGPVLRYRAGNVGRRPGSGRFVPPSSDRYRTLPAAGATTAEPERPGPPVVVNGLLAAALEDGAHPRALVSCFEALDTRVVLEQLERSKRRLERLGSSPDEAARVLDRARVAAQERVWRIVDRLFRTTRENLGRSVEAWLTWWFEARSAYPRQLRGPGQRARGRLVITPSPEAPPIEVGLLEHEEWTLGRADETDITVPERSVSRRHLTLLRLNTRYAYHDNGSRFGTTIRGARKDVGLLANGDVLELGRARLRFEDVPDDSGTISFGQLVGVDMATFLGLVDQRARSTVEALVRLLDTPRLLASCLDAATPWETPESITPAVTAFLDDQRTLALEALPAITETNHGDDPAAWRAWLEKSRAGLPKQVEPEGWSA